MTPIEKWDIKLRTNGVFLRHRCENISLMVGIRYGSHPFREGRVIGAATFPHLRSVERTEIVRELFPSLEVTYQEMNHIFSISENEFAKVKLAAS